MPQGNAKDSDEIGEDEGRREEQGEDGDWDRITPLLMAEFSRVMRARAQACKISPGQVVPVEDYLSCVEEAWKMAEYDEKQDLHGQPKHEAHQVPGESESVSAYSKDQKL